MATGMEVSLFCQRQGNSRATNQGGSKEATPRTFGAVEGSRVATVRLPPYAPPGTLALAPQAWLSRSIPRSASPTTFGMGRAPELYWLTARLDRPKDSEALVRDMPLRAIHAVGKDGFY